MSWFEKRSTEGNADILQTVTTERRSHNQVLTSVKDEEVGRNALGEGGAWKRRVDAVRE